VAGGLVGAVFMGGLLFWPGVRDPERRAGSPAEHRPGLAPGGE